MKKILILTKLLIVITSLIARSQQTNPEYTPTPETKKFEGTWEYKTSTEHITITLKNYEKQYLNFGNHNSYYADIVNGTLTYLQDANVVYKNQKVITNGRSGKPIAFELWGTYTDPGGRRGRLILTFEDKKDLSTLHMRIIVGLQFKGFETPEIKIPVEMTLTRVK